MRGQHSKAKPLPPEVARIVADVVGAAPACLQHDVLLKALDWGHVEAADVVRMLDRLDVEGRRLPPWLGKELILTGHVIGEERRQRLPPVLRTLDALNAYEGGTELPASIDSQLLDIADGEALEPDSLTALLRQLAEKNLVEHGVRLARQHWMHLPNGFGPLEAALQEEIAGYPEARLQLLSFSTTQLLSSDLKRAFAAAGLRASIEEASLSEVIPHLLKFEGDCDACVLALDADSFFVHDWRCDAATLQQRLSEQIDTLMGALEAALGRLGCPLLVSTFAHPSAPAAGFLDARHPTGIAHGIDAANRRLGELAQANGQLVLIDSDLAFADLAPAARRDDKLWYYGRIANSAAASQALAMSFADAWLSLKRGPAKVLALDLDNTLWGGIVGEDGVDALACGSDFPGNAFQAFQAECLRLKGQGMLLAILSKNDPAAIETFSRHSDMLLSADDFVATRIDWSPKPDNIRALAAELDLGLDSFIFIDDSPHEREAMRRMCPMVLVPELPDDPARRPAWLRRLRRTWPIKLTDEDARRSDLYAIERKAKSLRAAAPSFEDYLAGLDQRIMLAHTGEGTVGRVAQMHARTNQFNLTTERYDEAALRTMIADPGAHAVVHAAVADKFGDHGIVAAAVLRFDGAVAHVDSLLMSCRVIGRGVERSVLRELQRLATSRGAEALQGKYRATDRNGLVRDFYRDGGFQCCAQDADQSVWQWRVGEPEVEMLADFDVVWTETQDGGR